MSDAPEVAVVTTLTAELKTLMIDKRQVLPLIVLAGMR